MQTWYRVIRKDSRFWEYLLSELTPSDMERRANIVMVEQLLQRLATTGKGMNPLALRAAEILLTRDGQRTGLRASMEISAGSLEEMQALHAAVALRMGPPPSSPST